MAFILAAAAAAIALEGTLLAGSLALEAGASWEDTVASWLLLSAVELLGSEGVISHFERRFFLGGSSSLCTHKKKKKRLGNAEKRGATNSLPHVLQLALSSSHVFEYSLKFHKISSN